MNSDDTELPGWLQEQLAELPRSIEPERDLRPDIWAAIDAEPVVDIATRRGALWSVRYRLAAAALVLVAFTAIVTTAIIREQGGLSPMAAEHERESVALAARDVQTLEREYAEEVRELETIMRKSKGTLAPETIAILEHNLQIIDDAIREAHAALAADPNSDMLIDLLRSAYQRKLELLRTAAKSSALT